MLESSRRKFMKDTAGMFMSLPLLNIWNTVADPPRRNTILLRTGWKTDTWGDLAIIPAMYRLIQRHIPNTEVIIWPFKTDERLANLLDKNFTSINLVSGGIGENGEVDSVELEEAFEKSDLLLYSPGAREIIDWNNDNPAGIETRSLHYCMQRNIPYMIYGLGLFPADKQAQDALIRTAGGSILSIASSTRFEDSLKDKKIKLKNLVSAVDPLISFNMKDETPARNFLSGNGLLEKEFIVVNIKTSGLPEDRIQTAGRKIRSLMEKWIRDTGNPVLIMSDSVEDIESNRTILFEPLEGELKDKLYFYDGFMSPETAESIFEKARVVSGMSPEMIYLGMQAGSPVFHYIDWNLGNRSQSLLDLGMKDTIMDLEEASSEDLYSGLFAKHKSFVAALLESSNAVKESVKELEDIFRTIGKSLEKEEKKSKKEN